MRARFILASTCEVDMHWTYKKRYVPKTDGSEVLIDLLITMAQICFPVAKEIKDLQLLVDLIHVSPQQTVP